MGAQLRVYRRRIRATQSTRKITKAMELIAASRIAKAQSRINAARPYALELTHALSALGKNASIKHPLLTGSENPQRTAILVITSDRGLAGGYSSNAIKEANELASKVRGEGKEPVLFLIGRKAVSYYRFRGIPFVESWTGFSEKQPKFVNAQDAAKALVDLLNATSEGEVDGTQGVGHELYLVFTRFESMVTQTPVAAQLAPVAASELSIDGEDEEPENTGPKPAYDFEPEAEELLDHAAAPLHQCADLRRTAGVGGLGVGVAASGP